MVFKTKSGLMARCVAASAMLAGLALTGCHPDMWNQPNYEAYERNDFFENGMATRLPVEGTFAYNGQRREWLHPLYEKLTSLSTVPPIADTAFYTGKVDGTEMPTNYFEKITPELLVRGKERYEITCAACHGYTGEGGGLIVQRGFPAAVSLHIDRLREANDGYFFDVMTHGFGRMYSYAARVAPEDRWAVIAYIRALQYSQDVDISDPDSEVRHMVLAGLEKQKADAAAAHDAHGHGGDAHGDDAHGEHAGPEAHGAAEAAHTEATTNDSEHEANAH